MRQYYEHHWKTVLNLINNSLICAETNNCNFQMILSFYRSNSHSISKPEKKRVFPGSFSQLPETWVLKFCPELETLPASITCICSMPWHSDMRRLKLWSLGTFYLTTEKSHPIFIGLPNWAVWGTLSTALKSLDSSLGIRHARDVVYSL